MFGCGPFNVDTRGLIRRSGIHLIQSVYVPVTGVCVTLPHCHNSCADILAMFAAALGSLVIGYGKTGWERRSASEDPQALSVVLLL